MWLNSVEIWRLVMERFPALLQSIYMSKSDIKALIKFDTNDENRPWVT